MLIQVTTRLIHTNCRCLNLKDHDFIGSCQCSLGEIVAAQGKSFTLKLLGAKSAKDQSMTIIAEELMANKEVCKFRIK